MKKLTKEELNENAQRLMEAHKREVIYATQDGNYFLEKSFAMNHNNGTLKRDSPEWDGEIIPIEKEKTESPEELAKKEAADNLDKAEKAYKKALKALGKDETNEELAKQAAQLKDALEDAQAAFDELKK